MVLQSSSTRKQRGIMLHVDSEPTVAPSKLPGKLDWHGMMQAAGAEQERQNVSPASWSLIADWYIDCHWLWIMKKRRKTGMIAERETMEVAVHSCAVILYLGCVRVFGLCVCVWMYHREQGWFSPKHPQQLLRVHPSDLTYNCTNYPTISITFFPLSCVQFTFPAFWVISWSPKETLSEVTSHIFPHHSPTCQYYMYFFPLSKHHA